MSSKRPFGSVAPNRASGRSVERVSIGVRGKTGCTSLIHVELEEYFDESTSWPVRDNRCCAPVGVRVGRTDRGRDHSPNSSRGLNPGDDFRFVFVTDGIRDATSTNIAEYDSFVNDQAGGAVYNVVRWFTGSPSVSTDSVDAIDHVGQANAPVYLSDGTPISSSTNATGLWSGTIRNPINLDLAGSPVDSIVLCLDRYEIHHRHRSSAGRWALERRGMGSTTDILNAWVSSGRSPGGDLRQLYGISSVLVVAQSSVSEPSTLTLLGLPLSVSVAIGWARYRRHLPRGVSGGRHSQSSTRRQLAARRPTGYSGPEFPCRGGAVIGGLAQVFIRNLRSVWHAGSRNHRTRAADVSLAGT